MAEMHTLHSSLKRLLSFFSGFIVCDPHWPGIDVKFRGAVLTRVLGLSSAYLVHVGYLCLAIGCITVQEVALEHIFVTLRKNYRGYNDPDDYSRMELSHGEGEIHIPDLKCCGVKNYTDFCGSSFEMTTGPSHPRSCHKSSGRWPGCFPKLLKITKTQSFNWAQQLVQYFFLLPFQLPGILATLLLFIKLG
ncbi:unnamed protein product [Nyctereutes procyonoides]|uniref:(raccoon dog) hypothetical protein n=1 Tax=Nyctereutes procyonoides TaxID=34880 RepID=A0A811ZA48_NYCPR|nr:unnamed protein product [Nyctereutes procyonoides]